MTPCPTCQGLYTNTIPTGALTSQQGVTNADPATAPVRVLEPPTVAKTFVPPTISPNGVSRLTITLGNANAAAQTLSQALDDNLPAGVLVAATPNVVKTCPGAVTAAAGTGLVRYASGASIPAGGCTIEVSVTASVAGTYPNQILAGCAAHQRGQQRLARHRRPHGQPAGLGLRPHLPRWQQQRYVQRR